MRRYQPVQDEDPRIIMLSRVCGKSAICECIVLSCIGLTVTTLGMGLLIRHHSHHVAFAIGIILTAAGLYIIIHLMLVGWRKVIEILLINLCQRSFHFLYVRTELSRDSQHLSEA